MNITTDELRSWCPECAATLDIIAPGWVKCPECGWEQFKRGQSSCADSRINYLEAVEIRECYKEDSDLRIPYRKGRGGSKSRRKRKDRKKTLEPWYTKWGLDIFP